MFFGEDWERAEQELLCRLFPNTDLFVNVGANLGYYCLLSLCHDVRTIALATRSDELWDPCRQS